MPSAKCCAAAPLTMNSRDPVRDPRHESQPPFSRRYFVVPRYSKWTGDHGQIRIPSLRWRNACGTPTQSSASKRRADGVDDPGRATPLRRLVHPRRQPGVEAQHDRRLAARCRFRFGRRDSPHRHGSATRDEPLGGGFGVPGGLANRLERQPLYIAPISKRYQNAAEASAFSSSTAFGSRCGCSTTPRPCAAAFGNAFLRTTIRSSVSIPAASRIASCAS